MNSINAYGAGETISYDNEDIWGGYEITLNSIELTDSFDGIHTDSCGWEADYSSIMDENGNIIENIRKRIKKGDGVNSLDEVVSEESIPMHILKVNATFTNTRDETNEICISPQLFIFKDEKPLVWYDFIFDGDYKIMDSITGLSGSLDFFSLDTAPEKKGGKNEVILEPGESADVQIAFFVPDDLKDEIYLEFVSVGNSLASSLKDGYPVYDVRQQ